MKHDERCADEIGDDECSICRGEISDGFIERVKAAAAAPSIVMSAEQAMVWLTNLSAGGVAKR
ncbi:hypothetical protein [Sphingomonas sp. CFBP 8760]|uniref:hypothetical protein n=1 Tax=Sphingomonas sp. CFBP 8760 TaxID=2775282 RepID=UPI0017809934|nr:hypothetical protein [Sphingomonas sp. CFBP 8760]MBD8547994.1 hypothetical protein [Sphingomonas sp. CFBP 8760]